MSNAGQGGGQGGGSTPPAAFPQPTPLPHPFLLLLQRWNEEVQPLEQRSFESQKLAADFGKVALTSSVLLNGGALVALPALMQWLNPNGRALVGNMAMWFLFGLLFVFVALLVAYINYMAISQGFMCLANKRAKELDCGYVGTIARLSPDWIKADRTHKATNTVAKITQYIAVISAVSSFVAFGIGVWGFITLASFAFVPG